MWYRIFETEARRLTYITTKVHTLKSYPTYQFYAAADSPATDADGVFKICILETMRWIRSRLSDQGELPPEIDTPKPQDYALFPDDKITSFSYDGGFHIEVIYIDEPRAWSFRIVEPDMGANPGTEKERLPVNGRTFTTEIAFIRQTDCVEVGVRTICSEPADNTEDCEVFRPRLVRALAENPDITLHHSGFILDGEPLRVTCKGELERFISIFDDPERSLPLILIADSASKLRKPVVEQITSGVTPLGISQYKLTGMADIPEQRLSISPELLQYKCSVIPEKKEKKQKSKPAPPAAKSPAAEKLPVINYAKLANKLLGFAIVVFVQEGFFKQVTNKTKITLGHGEILTVQGREVIDKLTYDKYGKDMQTALIELYTSSVELPKRRNFKYGNVMFCYEAKQKEYHSKRKMTTSLEERCELYKMERDELKQQVRELAQQQTDMSQTSASIRLLQKKIEQLDNELDEQRQENEKLAATMSQKDEAYKRSSDLVSFYQQQYELAASFPANKNDVCGWIEEYFSDEIIVTSRAKTEMRKYNSALDLFTLCDGIVYLSAYAKYRKQKLSVEELDLYAERGKWSVQGCGKEALKLHREDYTVTHGGKQYTLDQHIKRGNQAEELIRVYFCWDDELKKIIIGSMPKHLATIKNAT